MGLFGLFGKGGKKAEQTPAGQELEPRQQFYYGRELYYHKRWEEALAVFETFLEEGRGWVENNIDACCH